MAFAPPSTDVKGAYAKVLKRKPWHNIDDADIFRPAAWDAFGMDKEGADYRACQNFGPLYK